MDKSIQNIIDLDIFGRVLEVVRSLVLYYSARGQPADIELNFPRFALLFPRLQALNIRGTLFTRSKHSDILPTIPFIQALTIRYDGDNWYGRRANNRYALCDILRHFVVIGELRMADESWNSTEEPNISILKTMKLPCVESLVLRCGVMVQFAP